MKRILFLTSGLYPLNGGRQLASYGYSKALGKIADVRTLSGITPMTDHKEASNYLKKEGLDIVFQDFGGSNVLDKLKYKPINKVLCWFLHVVPLYQKMVDCADKEINQYRPDIIIIDHMVMYFYFRYFKKQYPNIKYIYISHNVEYMNYLDNKNSRNLLSRIRTSLRKRIEGDLIQNTDWVFCISQNDKDILIKEFQVHNARKMLYAKPMIRFERIKTVKDMESYGKKLIIVGSMNWYPNIKGIVWFIQNVFSELVNIDKDYKLYIVGRNPDSDILDAAKPLEGNVVITGGVPSMDEYFAECDISVIPIFEGTGAKIKVLESIARGIPTVCSEFAAKDYDLKDEILTANEKNEFVKCILSIQNDADLRKRLYNNMKNYYENYFQFDESIINILQ